MSAASRTRSPAPSPITNPSRSRSNGRAASVGSSLWPCPSARMMSNAPNASGLSGTSTPPAIAASISPARIAPSASPIATAPDAQELVVERIEIVDLRSNLGAERRGVEAVDPLDGRSAGQDARPERLAAADGGQHPEAGDEDAAGHAG